MERIHDNAVNIVRLLLEENPAAEPFVLACSGCEREFGVHNPNASHGLCRRHLIKQYRALAASRGNSEKIQGIIRELEARPEDSFARDLSLVSPEERGTPHQFDK